MAIFVEQEKKKSNWFGLAIFIAIIAILGAAIYYLFFASVPGIEKVLLPRSSKLTSLEKIYNSKFKPEAVTNHPTFLLLKQYVNPVETSGSSGRANPFLPFR